MPHGGPAARRAGLEFVGKFLTTNLTSKDTTERNAGMLLRHPRPRTVASLTWRTSRRWRHRRFVVV
jgi:hypothetical protein